MAYRRRGHMRPVTERQKGARMDTDRIEGKAKEVEGEAQQTWGKAKDKARDAWEDVRDRGEDAVDEAEDHWDVGGAPDDRVEKSRSR